jgi:small subunit ribosomal protein S17
MKKIDGIVTGVKMKKTVTVLVERKRIHPIYKKGIKVTKKFHVHDEVGVKLGDRVRIQACRPISKTKKWRIIEIIKK